MRFNQSDQPLYDGKYPQDVFLRGIATAERLSLDERATLEHTARAERDAELGEALRDPRVQLQALHLCRKMVENDGETNAKFSKRIDTESLQRIVRSIEKELTGFIVALQHLSYREDETSQQCLGHQERIAALVDQIPLRPSTLRKWFLSAANDIPKTPQDIFEVEMGRIGDFPKGQGSGHLTSFKGRSQEVSAILTRLPSINPNSKLQKPVHLELIQNLSSHVALLRSAYEKLRNRGERNAVSNQTIGQLRSVLELLEKQLIHHSHPHVAHENLKTENVEEKVAQERFSTREMIERHLGVVVSIAKGFVGEEGVEFLDLVQHGGLKLTEAAQAHDPSRGRFTTYIYNFLRKEIRAHIRQNTFVKTPASFPRQLRLVRRAMKKYVESNMDYVETEHKNFFTWLVRETGMSPSIIKRCLFWLDKNWQHPISLDRYVRDTHEQKAAYKEDDPAETMSQLSTGHEWMSLSDTITYSGEQEDRIESEAQREILRAQINKVLNTLSYREREIVSLRYGLADGYTYSLEEVSEIFKVTRERVRQIEANAVRKLQQPSRSQWLSEFLD